MTAKETGGRSSLARWDDEWSLTSVQSLWKETATSMMRTLSVVSLRTMKPERPTAAAAVVYNVHPGDSSRIVYECHV